jgi:hypothetical protein
MPLGHPFAPTMGAADDPQAARLRKRTPVQQALQTLSLRLPRVIGAEGIVPQALMGRGGGAGGQTDQSFSQMSDLIKAMTGGSEPAPAYEAPRFSGGGPTQEPTYGGEPSYEVPEPGEPGYVPPGGGMYQAPTPAPAPQLPPPPTFTMAQPGDPNYVGGGGVDAGTSPPPQQTPPQYQNPPPNQGGYYGGQGGYYNPGPSGYYGTEMY